MAFRYWRGVATPVAQQSTVQITSYGGGTTYSISIGGISVSAASSVDANGTAAALNTALQASTHPYFTAITFSVSTDTITLTAAVAGVPFVATSGVTGGAGTIGSVTAVTASSGPNDWSTVANWYTANGSPASAVPASTDTVIFADGSVNVCWGLLTGVTGVTLIRQDLTYTGKIGLNYAAFATSANGETVNANYPEYRQLYASIGVATYRHGDYSNFGSATGSPRSLWDFGSATTCAAEIINTSATSTDSPRPALRLLFAKSASTLTVRSAPGGVGIASEVPSETSTLGTINIADTSSVSKIFTGTGLTVTTYIQDGGNNVLQSNATITTVTCNGGILRTEGTGAHTTLNAYGGTVYSNNTGTTGTMNLQGGNVSSFGSSVARTWSTINVFTDSTLTVDPNVITYTTLAAQRRLVISAA